MAGSEQLDFMSKINPDIRNALTLQSVSNHHGDRKRLAFGVGYNETLFGLMASGSEVSFLDRLQALVDSIATLDDPEMKLGILEGRINQIFAHARETIEARHVADNFSLAEVHRESSEAFQAELSGAPRPDVVREHREAAQAHLKRAEVIENELVARRSGEFKKPKLA